MTTLETLAPLAAAFPNFHLTGPTATQYEEHLADIPIEELKTAVAALIRTARWFPPIGDIRAKVTEIRRDSRPASPNVLPDEGPRSCDAGSPPLTPEQWAKLLPKRFTDGPRPFPKPSPGPHAPPPIEAVRALRRALHGEELAAEIEAELDDDR